MVFAVRICIGKLVYDISSNKWHSYYDIFKIQRPQWTVNILGRPLYWDSWGVRIKNLKGSCASKSEAPKTPQRGMQVGKPARDPVLSDKMAARPEQLGASKVWRLSAEILRRKLISWFRAKSACGPYTDFWDHVVPIAEKGESFRPNISEPS